MAKRKGPAVNEPQEKADTPGEEYFEIIPLATWVFNELAPSWDHGSLQKTIRQIVFMAQPDHVLPGVLDSACTFIPGGGVIQLHFPGDGRVLIDPGSDCSPDMKAIPNC